jgi:hypothetical protein
MLNRHAAPYPHHVDPAREHDFTRPLAVMSEHPRRRGLFGLTNKSEHTWTIRGTDGTTRQVAPGESVSLRLGMSLLISGVPAEILAGDR